jgi:hypothetical protein
MVGLALQQSVPSGQGAGIILGATLGLQIQQVGAIRIEGPDGLQLDRGLGLAAERPRGFGIVAEQEFACVEIAGLQRDRLFEGFTAPLREGEGLLLAGELQGSGAQLQPVICLPWR